MAVTYGFYDAVNGDRAYNAEEFTSIFDGIINEGILPMYGGSLEVVASSPASMTINVRSGRAWFDHTWTLNDAVLPLNVASSHATLNRIDAVVLEVNKDSRENSIYIMQGTAASTPSRPSMGNTATVTRYPLAYIYISNGVSSISASSITDNRGTEECPYATVVNEMEGRVVTSLNGQTGNVTLAIPSANSSASNIKATGAANSAGTSVLFARADHVHKGPDVPSPNNDTSGLADVGATKSVGTRSTYARADHIHRGVKSINGLYGALTVSEVQTFAVIPLNGFNASNLISSATYTKNLSNALKTSDYSVIHTEWVLFGLAAGGSSSGDLAPLQIGLLDSNGTHYTLADVATTDAVPGTSLWNVSEINSDCVVLRSMVLTYGRQSQYGEYVDHAESSSMTPPTTITGVYATISGATSAKPIKCGGLLCKIMGVK